MLVEGKRDVPSGYVACKGLQRHPKEMGRRQAGRGFWRGGECPGWEFYVDPS